MAASFSGTMNRDSELSRPHEIPEELFVHWLPRLPARTIVAAVLSGLVAAVTIAATPTAASADTMLTVRYR